MIGTIPETVKLRIGINAIFKARGGSLTNILMLAHEWRSLGFFREHKLIFFCSLHTANLLKQKLDDNAEIIIMRLADRGLIWRIISEQIILPLVIRRFKLDVLFCPGNIMPLLSDVPTVTTFQNAAPFCDTVTPSTVGFRNYIRLYIIGCFMRLTAIRSKKVIFISNFFMNLFIKKFNFSKDKGVVIYRARDNI